MRRSTEKKAIWLSIAVLLFGVVSGFGQGPGQRPMLQDIKVYREEPVPSSTPLVKKTGSSQATNADVSVPSLSGVKTSIQILAETPIPGYSGVLVESLDGKVVVENGSELAYNPASNVKVATTYAVLKSYGPNFRFPTNIWTDGSYEQETATIHGNLYISGKDPVFSFEDAVRIANVLNQMGIRTIKGDLVVTDNFGMNYSGSPATSSRVLFATLDATKRSAAATRAWGSFRVNSGQLMQLNEMPSVSFSGSVYVQPMPGNLNLLFTHESAPMRDIVKAMMCYSNNELSEALGDMVGGPYAIARTVQQDTGSLPMEFSLQTASGLGINRVTPRAMMKLLRQLRSQLEGWKMSFTDIMPVAGMDDGTLEGRFASDYSRGSVVGKTGTLARTDSGVSALSGEITTRGGKFLFVIFNQRGSVARFRSFQNDYISLIQSQFGGPAPLSYAPTSLDARLARTRITYPQSRPRISD